MDRSLTKYQSLLVEYQPRPIRSEAAYRRALRQVETLMKKPRLTAAERDIVEALSILIEQYEAARQPTPQVPPDRVLAHLIESKGVTQAQISRGTGIPKSNLSAILAGRRAVSKTSAVTLGRYFGLPAEVFLSDVE